MAYIYDSKGNIIDVGGTTQSVSLLKGINHRGYNSIAPENTLPAYQLSKEKGFHYVECDVAFTSDNIPVLLHDSTIDRTSNGSGAIASMTFAQARQYDFGSWKSSAYTGTKISSLEEFLSLCRNLGLHPYIEIKNDTTYSESQLRKIVDLVKAYGMQNNVTYISFSSSYLTTIKNYDATARLGYLVWEITDNVVSTCGNLKTATNEVFINAYYSVNGYGETTTKAKNALLPLEFWVVNDTQQMRNLDNYVSGVSSDTLVYDAIR